MKRVILFLGSLVLMNFYSWGDGVKIGSNLINSNDTSIIDIASFHKNGFSGISKFDRFEVGIKLPANIQQQINVFLNNGNGINPYNPDQIKVQCEFVNKLSNHTYYRDGFYYRDYKTQNNLWIEQNTEYKYRVRFAPPLTGNYSCKIIVSLNGVLTGYHSEFEINVINSDNPGHLSMADGNLRKMSFENGTVFFGMGEDIAYADQDWGAGNPNFTATPLYYPDGMSSPNTHNRQRSYYTNLADNGGNFVRMRLDPWSVPIVGPDKSKPDPFGFQNLYNAVSNYNHNQMFMWEMDSTLALCENRGIYLLLNIMLEDQIHNGYSGDNTWRKNPYSTILSPDLQGLKNFFSDSTAKAYYKKQLYYINARWGYSANIAVWQLINEAQGIGENRLNTNDPSTRQQPFVVDINFRNNVYNWICEMKSYLESNFYPSHPITSGFQADLYEDGKVALSIADIQPSCLNIYLETHYSSFINGNGKYADANKGRYSTYKSYYNKFRPFLISEVGMLDGMNQTDMLSDRMYHNTIWATSMGGGISCALHWHDWRQEFNVPHRNNFKALRKFFDNIVDLKIQLEPFYHSDDDQLFNPGVTKTIHNYYMLSSNRLYGIGWAQNNCSNWTLDWDNFPIVGSVNLKDSVKKASKFDGNIEQYDCNSTVQDPGIIIEGLKGNKRYKVKIYDAYDNAKKLDEFIERSNPNGKLSFKRFMPKNSSDPFYPDYAYTIEYINWVAITLYPNPANNRVYLRYNNEDLVNASIKVVDVLGRNMPVIIADNVIHTDILPSGIYFVIVRTDNYEGGVKLIIN